MIIDINTHLITKDGYNRILHEGRDCIMFYCLLRILHGGYEFLSCINEWSFLLRVFTSKFMYIHHFNLSHFEFCRLISSNVSG